MRHTGPLHWLLVIRLLAAALLLAACSPGGARPFPAHPTQTEALSKVLHRPVQIAYTEPFGEGRTLVLFRTDQHPGLSPTLLEQTWLGQWRMSDVVGLSPILRAVGPLTYDHATVGLVEERVQGFTSTRAEAWILFGEILNPAITWVEITPANEGTEATRATVKHGIWLVKLPAPNGAAPQVIITAGSVDRRLFSARMASVPLDDPGEVAEFDDRLAGILFRSRYARYPRVDGDGYRFDFPDGSLSIQQRERSGQIPQELLARYLGTVQRELGVDVREQGTGRLGGHAAAFVRLSASGPGGTRQNKAVYLVVTPEADYEVVCASAQVKNPLPWEDLQPRCDRLLATVQLGR